MRGGAAPRALEAAEGGDTGAGERPFSHLRPSLQPISNLLGPQINGVRGVAARFNSSRTHTVHCASAREPEYIIWCPQVRLRPV